MRIPARYQICFREILTRILKIVVLEEVRFHAGNKYLCKQYLSPQCESALHSLNNIMLL